MNAVAMLLKSVRTFPQAAVANIGTPKTPISNAVITEYYDGKTGHICYLRVSQFPIMTLPIGALLGYSNVIQLKLDCYVKDIVMVFAFAESLPRLHSLEFVNDAIVGGEFGNSCPPWLCSKAGSVKKITLAVDAEGFEDAKQRPIDKIQFQLNTLLLLKYTREFFPELRLVELIRIPFNLDDAKWFGKKFPNITYLFAKSSVGEVNIVYAPATSAGEPDKEIKIHPHDKPLLEHSLRIWADNIVITGAEEKLKDKVGMEWD